VLHAERPFQPNASGVEASSWCTRQGGVGEGLVRHPLGGFHPLSRMSEVGREQSPAPTKQLESHGAAWKLWIFSQSWNGS